MQPVRSLLRAPAFSVAAIIALGLGIGASAALFSVIDGVLLRPLPYAQQDRLVIVDAERAGRATIPSYAQFLDWRARARSLEGMAYAFGEAFLLRGTEGTEAVAIAMVSEGFFPLMGAIPTFGRLPSADEEAEGSSPVIVISARLWRDHFGGDSSVLGSTLDTDKGSFAIVGVMPPGFAFPSWASAWTPLAPMRHQFPALQKRDWRADARAIARLKPGVSREQALQDLNAVAAGLASELPATDAGMKARLTPIVTEVVGDIRRPLLLFTGAVGILLLLACANVGTLALVRGSVRSRELALRSALGATHWRIVRLLLGESALLALAGAGVGLVLAFWMLNLLRVAAPAGLPRLDEIALDGRAVAFTIVIASLTPLLFGLAPALHAARLGLTPLARIGPRASTGVREVGLRSGLLVAQVALSLVLLVSAGLLIRSFALLRAVEPGIDAERLLTVRIQPPTTRYRSPDALLAVYGKVRDEVGRIPGVERAALVNHQGTAGVPTDVRTPRQSAEAGDGPRALYRLVSAGYFDTLGQPVLRGRGLTTSDMSPSSRAAVINAHLAALLWPAEDPIGKPIRIWRQAPGRADYGEPLDLEVVGVAGDAVFQSPGGPSISVVYLPFPVSPTDQASLMIRTSGRPGALVAPVRRAILAVDRDIPTNRIGPVAESTWESLIHRFDLILLSAFAISALALTAVGLYGVVAYVLTQRRHEIGVRRAIGATDTQLLWSFVGQGIRLAVVGVIIGIPLALVSGRFLRATLFGTGPLDPPTFIGVALLLVGVAALASYLPARRLSQIDPLEALRAE